MEFHSIHGKIYSDQTGKFPVPSAEGHNYIVATPYRKHKSEMVHAFEGVYPRLTMAGAAPRVHVRDNECPDRVDQLITSRHSKYQRVPPHDHRHNAAERAIRTFTNHFIAIICGVDPEFPMHQWDKLLPQAELTLNIMRASRLNTHTSAWTMLLSVYNYQRTPIIPAGCKIITYSSTQQRRTWQRHGHAGFYLGPALEH
jgi:hypothetical protein